MAYKAMSAMYQGKCKACGGAISVGDAIVYETLHKKAFHPACKPATAPKPATKAVLKPSQAYSYPKPASMSVPAVAKSEPKTQKGKGIRVLQNAGILPLSAGIVCCSLDEAKQAFHAIPGDKFCRPCPITPRHGFVDSRPVKTIEALEALWAETMKADPQGELIVMQLVKATHNCVWQPGMLSVGPGHDGATAGHHSITIPMTETISAGWKDLSQKAGVNFDTSAPFIETVSHDGIDQVITQIRAGAGECPTEPDWIPAPMTVGEVIAIDGTVKADNDAMLAWEEQAKTLKPGFHIVYDEGGNLGDHWSVHARLNKIAVVTTFKPYVGQELPKMGVDLVPLEPQAIMWGFLGGLEGPSLKGSDEATRRKRTRATVAAILGTHHGLRMGGAAGEHLGASVALFLRLSQAALWGEARHANSHISGSLSQSDAETAKLVGTLKGKSRQQIFSEVLDDWSKGRAGLRQVTRLFHHAGWGSGGFGGKAWAAIGHATVNLDTAIVNLFDTPSRTNAAKVIAALTTAVNLAHNGVASGCFLNKFAGKEWFDMAAMQDPRAATFAGPVWYEATLVDGDARMARLAEVEGLKPIEVGFAAPKGNVLAHKADTGKVPASKAQFNPTVPPMHTPKGKGKIGSMNPVTLGQTVAEAGIPGPVKAAQCKGSIYPNGGLHFQIEVTGGGYVSGIVSLPDKLPRGLKDAIEASPKVESMGGTGVSYYSLKVNAQGAIYVRVPGGLVTVLGGGLTSTPVVK